MIIITQPGWHPRLDDAGFTPSPSVGHSPAVRLSSLLGPDGNPLLVGYERPKIGFDLTPKKGK